MGERIQAVGEWVVVVRPPDGETIGGIILPSQKEGRETEGYVASVGPRVKTKLEEGDKVYFTKAERRTTDYQGRRCFMVKEEDIVARIIADE